MQRDEDVRRIEVHADVATAAGLGAQRGAELLGIVEGLAEHQPSPAEVLNDTVLASLPWSSTSSLSGSVDVAGEPQLE